MASEEIPDGPTPRDVIEDFVNKVDGNDLLTRLGQTLWELKKYAKSLDHKWETVEKTAREIGKAEKVRQSETGIPNRPLKPVQ